MTFVTSNQDFKVTILFNVKYIGAIFNNLNNP